MLNPDATYWFPLRIRHSSTPRLMTMKSMLDSEECVAETYVPMEYRTENYHTELMPVINNLIFVRTTYNSLKEIRQNQTKYEPLRYIMHYVSDGKNRILEVMYVPDAMMQTFIRVTKDKQDNVIFLDNLEFACKPGTKVCITDGVYTGVVGVVKHIKKNLCVVVAIEGVAAAAIMYVPRKHLRYVTEEEE
ncbi:MAG: hypothetical protein IK117_00265 [Bacteroidales bacterium]|nr:hypothetical protein [Bacteroidales bacterium]